MQKIWLGCMRIVLGVAFTLGAALGVADSIEPFATPKLIEREGFQDFFAEVAPGVYVAGQPSAEALATLAEEGVTTVINLRTHQEMNNRQVVPFDEAHTIAELGMEYVHIPQGGPQTPYSPLAKLMGF